MNLTRFPCFWRLDKIIWRELRVHLKENWTSSLKEPLSHSFILVLLWACIQESIAEVLSLWSGPVRFVNHSRELHAVGGLLAELALLCPSPRITSLPWWVHWSELKYNGSERVVPAASTSPETPWVSNSGEGPAVEMHKCRVVLTLQARSRLPREGPPCRAKRITALFSLAKRKSPYLGLILTLS